MQFTQIKYEVKESIAFLTLNRPDFGNSLDVKTCEELMEASLHCSEDSTVRAMVLTGAGKFFSAGGDLKSFAAAGSALPVVARRETTHLHSAISRFRRMNAPIVAAVNGPAAGAGFSLVLASDLVVAGESSFFSMAYTRAGLVPDGSSTYFLPRVVGLHRAMELVLTNRRLSAKEASEWGIVNRVVKDAEVVEAATALAKELAQGATKAFGEAKRLIQFSLSESLETQMELESQAIAGVAKSRDVREGIEAFLAKRTPKFQGI